MRCNNFFLLIVFSAFINLALYNRANAVPTYMVYQGQVFDPSGMPLEDTSVDFKVSIYAPGGACLLYEENHTGKNMANSGGVFSLEVGSGTTTGSDPGIGLFNSFNNLDSSSVPCYATPAQFDQREVVVEFTTASAGAVTLASQKLDSAPYAMYATSLDGVANAVGDRLGIRNNNPGADLHVTSSGLGVMVDAANVGDWLYRGRNTLGATVVGLGLDTDNGMVGLYDSASDLNTFINGRVDRPTYFDAGNVGIGERDPDHKLHVDLETVDVITKHGLYVNRHTEFTSDVTSYDKGIMSFTGDITLGSGLTDNGYKIAVEASSYISNDTGFSGTIRTTAGLWARGGVFKAANGAHIENSYGILVDHLTSDADATIENAYGVYIVNGAGTTQVENEYGLYQATARAKNYFGGDVGLDTTIPKANLDVVGYARIANGTITLNVDPTQTTDERARMFTTVNEAVYFASEIYTDEIIVISVAAGTHVVDPFSFYSKRKYYQIQGATATASDTVLDFSATSGGSGYLVSVLAGEARFQNLKILGPAGLSRACMASLKLGYIIATNIEVESCSNGFIADDGATLRAVNSSVINAYIGASSQNSSKLYLNSITINTTNSYGIYAGRGGYIGLSGATVNDFGATCTFCTALLSHLGGRINMENGTYNFTSLNGTSYGFFRSSSNSFIQVAAGSPTMNFDCSSASCASIFYMDLNGSISIAGTLNINSPNSSIVRTLRNSQFNGGNATCNITAANRAVYSNNGIAQVSYFGCSPVADGGVNVYAYPNASLYSANGFYDWTASTWGL